jgi:hypothetical protein
LQRGLNNSPLLLLSAFLQQRMIVVLHTAMWCRPACHDDKKAAPEDGMKTFEDF